MITVVNVRGMLPNDPSVVYIGRACYGWKGSVLGNPFKGERSQAIVKYRIWLRKEWWIGGAVRVELVRLAILSKHQDIVLGCWCAPLPCHGDVVKDAIEKIAATL